MFFSAAFFSIGAGSEVIAVPKLEGNKELSLHLFLAGLGHGGTTPIPLPCGILAGGHRVDSLYDAFEEQPDNPQVKRSVLAGIPDVTLIDARSPRDMHIFFMDENNEFNGIAANVSFLEVYKLCERVEKAWCNHRAEMRTQKAENTESAGSAEQAPKKRSQAGDEKLYASFIQERFPGKWDSFAEYDSTKQFRHSMIRDGMWEAYAKYAQEFCVFLEPGLNKTAVFHINNDIRKQLSKHPEHKQVIPFVLRFAIPTNDGLPWVLKEVRPSAAKVRLLLMPMEESRVFRLSRSATTLGGETPPNKDTQVLGL